jgi:Mrp family chromosome partitioning ATPase
MKQRELDPFLILRWTLEAELPDSGVVVAVGSPLAEDGTSAVAAGLARALAAAGHRTLALDGGTSDGAGTLRERLGATNAKTILLDGATTPIDVAISRVTPSCDALTLRAGSLAGACASSLRDFFEMLRGRYDYTVVDVGTIGGSGVIAARGADGVLLAIRENRRAHAVDDETVQLLRRMNVRIIGVVATTMRGRARTPAPALADVPSPQVRVARVS